MYEYPELDNEPIVLVRLYPPSVLLLLLLPVSHPVARPPQTAFPSPETFPRYFFPPLADTFPRTVSKAMVSSYWVFDSSTVSAAPSGVRLFRARYWWTAIERASDERLMGNTGGRWISAAWSIYPVV